MQQTLDCELLQPHTVFYLETVRDSWQPSRLSAVGAVFIKKKGGDKGPHSIQNPIRDRSWAG